MTYWCLPLVLDLSHAAAPIGWYEARFKALFFSNVRLFAVKQTLGAAEKKRRRGKKRMKTTLRGKEEGSHQLIYTVSGACELYVLLCRACRHHRTYQSVFTPFFSELLFLFSFSLVGWFKLVGLIDDPSQ